MKSNLTANSKKSFVDVKKQSDRQVSMKLKPPSSAVSTISQKQLNEIQSYFAEQFLAAPKSHEKDAVLSNISKKSADKEAIVDYVLRRLIEVNSDKFSESSLVKLFASVHMDAKSKLEANAPYILMSQNPNTEESSSITGLKKSGSNENERSLEKLASKETELQSNKERIGSTASVAVDLQSELLPSHTPRLKLPEPSDSSVQSNVRIQLSTNKQDLEFIDNMKIGTASTNNSVVSALSPMAFGSGQDAHLLKQEESRRQWKAALDEQIKEHQLMRERHLQETLKEDNSDRRQLAPVKNDRQRVSDHRLELTGPNTSDSSVRTNPLISHPSASHFLSSNFLLPDSIIGSASSSSGTKDQSGQPWKVGFNRVRGFTQQIYNDSAESAERSRLAHEARLINLKQIEERRRQKEEEKARLIMEEKKEEERISRERLRLQQMAEVENARKRANDLEEIQRTQYLHESLIRAQEDAKLNKVRKHPYYSKPDRNENSINSHLVPKPELQPMGCYITPFIENENKVNNSLYTLASSCVWNVSDNNSSYNNNHSLPPAKSSLGVQTSFPEDIGIQTDGLEYNNSQKKQFPNDNTQIKNGIKGTSTYKLTSSDKLMKSHSEKSMNQPKSSSDNCRQQSRQNCSMSVEKTSQHKNFNANKKETSQKLKPKQNSKVPPQRFPISNNDNVNSLNEKSELYSSKAWSSSSDQLHTIKNRFERTVQDGYNMKTRIPVPISTAYSLASTSTPKQQVPIAKHTPRKTSCLDHQNPYGPMELIRTYDILNPNDVNNMIIPTNQESTTTDGNTKKTDVKDSAINRNSVYERPINRQETILHQLSEIRKGLQLRQMLCESGKYDADSDD
ncbi:unnamed protein product [Heterobilharzia americana]|nr:unnamed protein product [Heterobilharzia americana]